MFLSKRGGVYHLWYVNPSGKRQKVSTHATTKSDAVEFLRAFNAGQYVREQAVKGITLERFTESFLDYSRSIHTPKTVLANQTALSELGRSPGPE